MDRSMAEFWMREALIEARKAESEKEVPIGAVLLLNEKIIGRGHNKMIQLHDPTAHAEVVALRQAAHQMQNYRIPGAILIVTVEPCVMCAGALIQARIDEIIYGAPDPKAGAIQSCFNIASSPILNHQIKASPGVLEEDCRSILTAFFNARRGNLP
jgi:tRNA(adenine34) deaminase